MMADDKTAKGRLILAACSVSSKIICFLRNRKAASDVYGSVRVIAILILC